MLPSRDEPFAMSPLEAMAAGCLVIVPHDNGSSCYITHEYDGLIFNSSSYRSFKMTLSRALEDRTIVKGLGRQAAETIKKNHTGQSCLDVINRLIA